MKKTYLLTLISGLLLATFFASTLVDLVGAANVETDPMDVTITESKGFARYGVMVEMITEGDKLEYVINKMSAKEVGIVISSKIIDKAKATFG